MGPWPIAIGIISGLITYLLVASGRWLWGKKIVPWYEDKVYRDVRLDGDWQTTFYGEDGGEFNETATVHQTANNVTGDIQLQGETAIKHYEFQGKIANLLLTAEYWLKGASSRDRGAFCVTVKENGKKLEGYLSWYSDSDDDIRFSEYVWHKK